MKTLHMPLLAFSTVAKPGLPSLPYHQTSFAYTKQANQLFTIRRPSRSRTAFLTNLVSSAARGAPIFGPAMSIVEEEISLTSRDGHQVGAYFVYPEEAASTEGRGVILMTDILGFKDEETRSVAKRFAEASLPIIVPDLFRGAPWTPGRSMTEYESWRSQHVPARVREDAKSAHDFLIEKGFATRLGMVGFCFGGGRTMEEIAMASQGLNPKVAVAFYPTRFDPESVARNATCSLLFISGDEDELVPMSIIEKLQQAVGKESCDMEDCEIQIVENAGHGFAHHPKTEQNEVDGEVVLSRALRYMTSKL